MLLNNINRMRRMINKYLWELIEKVLDDRALELATGVVHKRKSQRMMMIKKKILTQQ